MRHFSNERRSKRSHAPQNNDYYCRRELRKGGERHYNGCNNRGNYKKSPQVYRKSPQDYGYKRNPQGHGSRKSPQEDKKGFIQPCPLHGPGANYSYTKCLQNPCNQAESRSRDNKRALNSHHQDMGTHDNRFLSSNDESRGDNCTPVLSDSELSSSVESKGADDKYHLSLGAKCPKKQRVTFVPKQSHKSDVARLPKERKGSKDIERDDTFDDGYLTELDMELELEDMDLENGTNP